MTLDEMKKEDCRFCGNLAGDGWGDLTPIGDEDCHIFCAWCGAYSIDAHENTKNEARIKAWENWNKIQIEGERYESRISNNPSDDPSDL